MATVSSSSSSEQQASALTLLLLLPVLYISYHLIKRTLATTNKNKPTTHAILNEQRRSMLGGRRQVRVHARVRRGAGPHHRPLPGPVDPVEVSWKVKKWLNVGSVPASVGSRRRSRTCTRSPWASSARGARARRPTTTNHHVRDDVLSRFVASAEHSDETLIDIVLSFLIAGRETTSSALTWFFWLLPSHPAVTARVVADVRAARAASTGTRPGEPLGFDALRGMHYLHAALTESMRLYPPAPLGSQSCAAADVLPDGTRVGEGWSVTYSAYAMGRLRSIWGDDCAEFRPERWLDGDGAFRPESPFRYAVFHAGPRMCLGKEMAYVQMKSVVASVLDLEEFVVDVRKEVAGGGVPEHVLSVTLRMKGGLPVQVRKREVAGSAV